MSAARVAGAPRQWPERVSSHQFAQCVITELSGEGATSAEHLGAAQPQHANTHHETRACDARASCR